MKHSAGTYESSDCIVQVSTSDQTEVVIESVVYDQFKDAIETVLFNTLNEHKITNVKVECFDKGALDYTIKSRLETALKRGGYIE